MAIAEIPNAAAVDQDQRFLLPHPVSWQLYERMLSEWGEHSVRMTYDQGTLEFMSPSKQHENLSRRIHMLIKILAQELRIPIQSAGATTWKRADLDQGLEPDECYYIANEALVRGSDNDNLANCPPPDLAVEIEVSHSAVNRLAIYAALRVPEIWRCDDQAIRPFVLNSAGQYVPSDVSQNLPLAPLAVMMQFLATRHESDETTWENSFREWVREHLVR